MCPRFFIIPLEMTQDHHYSDNPSHYVAPRPGIEPGFEPGLTACEASMLPTTPPGGSIYHVLLIHCNLTNLNKPPPEPPLPTFTDITDISIPLEYSPGEESLSTCEMRVHYWLSKVEE